MLADWLLAAVGSHHDCLPVLNSSFLLADGVCASGWPADLVNSCAEEFLGAAQPRQGNTPEMFCWVTSLPLLPVAYTLQLLLLALAGRARLH